MKKVISLLVLFVMLSCSEGSNNKQLRMLQSHSVTLLALNSINIVDKFVDVTKSKYKLVIYSCTESCNNCEINNIENWQRLIDWSKQYDEKLIFYFLFQPSERYKKSVYLQLKHSDFNYPMLLDSLGEFERLNPHLPKNKAMHTFLLDENNNVVLVGNPLHNPKIEKMFKEIVEEKLGKKE